MAWNQPIEAIATSVRQYPRTPAPRSMTTTELAAKSVNESPPHQVTEMNKEMAYPLYQRDHLKANKAPTKEVTRYVHQH